MAALLLAAGRGARMRPLSDTCPKPLLEAGGRRLIEWQIAALARAGVRDIVINTAHLPEAFEPVLGDGSRMGVSIRYSQEGQRAEDALETCGGIVRALSLLGDAPFLVVSGDIVTDYDYARLAPAVDRVADGTRDAHLVLVDNPAYHPGGDMGCTDGLAHRSEPRLTYANIGVFPPRIFAGLSAERRKLFPFLYQHVEQGRVGAEHFRGRWFNVGTPGDLAGLRAELVQHPL